MTDFFGVVGSQGSQGVQGTQGFQGATGSQGAQGTTFTADSGWQGPQSAGSKTVAMPDYDAATLLTASTAVGLQGMNAQVDKLTKWAQATQTALAAKKYPNA